MASTDWAQLVAQYFNSAGYHEAGHMTVAVRQQLPLCEQGILVYPPASGVSKYCHRLPGNFANSEKDQLERVQTIIALYAGSISQRNFFPECPEADWASDMATIRALLKEMHPADLTVRNPK